jgi:hypothetical protein
MIKLKDLILEGLISVKKIDDNILNKIVAAAQKQYDEWAQNEEGYDEELGHGGICHLIADDLADILSGVGIECSTVCDSSVQHVYLVCKFREGIYSIDIPYYFYESGGGFSWKKKKDIKFDSSHVIIHPIDRNPRNFKKYIDYD